MWYSGVKQVIKFANTVQVIAGQIVYSLKMWWRVNSPSKCTVWILHFYIIACCEDIYSCCCIKKINNDHFYLQLAITVLKIGKVLHSLFSSINKLDQDFLNVTSQGKMFFNGFPFSNSFLFTSCLSAVRTAWSPVCWNRQPVHPSAHRFRDVVFEKIKVPNRDACSQTAVIIDTMQ